MAASVVLDDSVKIKGESKLIEFINTLAINAVSII